MVHSDVIVMTRLLVMQSKRLLLMRAERKLANGDENVLPVVDRLRRETALAHETYRQTVFDWGDPNSIPYRSFAYNGLVDSLTAYVNKLRESAKNLPAPEKAEVANDIARLEMMASKWRREVLRQAA